MKRIFFIAAALTCTCLAAFSQERKTVLVEGYYQDQPLPGWETEVHDRVEVMANVTWTPLLDMAKCYYTKDAMFDAGQEWKGIPYSGVNNYAGFVGRDVSFHTFLSAINNPKSKMYTVNYHLPPYNHAKTGPFYGTVCGPSVLYAWGVPFTIWTKRIREGQSLYLEDVGNKIDSVKLYDSFCWFKGVAGHVVLISGIGRDKEGKILQIKTFEGTGPVNKVRVYTIEEFHEKFDKYDFHIYRYDYDKWGFKLPPFIEQVPGQTDKFNNDFCPEEGELLTYPQGKTIAFNVFNKKKFDVMVLKKDGEKYLEKNIKGKDYITLENLPEGLYEAVLVASKDNKVSAPQLFEVAQNSCEAWFENGTVRVKGSRNGAYPLGVYFTKDFSAVRACKEIGDGVWEAYPQMPSTDSVRVSIAGKYRAYWAKVNHLK